MPRTRSALLIGTATLVALWVAFGLVLEAKPPGGGCTAGLDEGAYGDLLVPAHLVAYAILVGLIAWLRPPARREAAVLGASAAVVLVSLAWPGPIAVVGIAALVGALPATLWALITLATIVRQGRDDRVRPLLWVGLLVALPATFMGAYVNGAGFFCF